jgi:pimeloyl-ACP methyl ester carboxylesterase
MKYKLTHIIPILVLLFLCFAPSISFSQPSPPPQPEIGPGGYDYPHASVKKNGPYWAKGHFLNNNYKYYIFEPANPAPEEAPIVLFLHGWLAYKPKAYLGWMEHIVKKGYVVVWVQYDAFLRPFKTLADNAMKTWKDAMNRLDTSLHVRPEKDGMGQIKTAIIGHSMGGYLSAILAARAADPRNGMPRPYAIVAVEPGGLRWLPPEDFAEIEPDTKMVIVVGDEDMAVCKSTAVAIWEETWQIPDENRDFLLVKSDDWGSPAQISNHYFPCTDRLHDMPAVDARDFYVTYKLSVGALNCAFRDTDCEYALGNGSFEQVDMGQWSDGQPMNAMVWVEDPDELETTCKDPGFRTAP